MKLSITAALSFATVTVLSLACANVFAQTASPTPTPKPASLTDATNPGSKVFTFKADPASTAAGTDGSKEYTFGVDKPAAAKPATGTDIQSATYVKNFIGYPVREVYAALEPTDYAGKFTYSGVSFNYNNSTASAGEIGFREYFNPDTIASISARFYSAATDAGTPGHFVVTASKVSMYDITARANFCIGDNYRYFSKLCPGFDLGLSAYPVLGFTSQTNLTLQQAKEIMIGPNFFVQIPLIYDLHWDNLFTLDFGTGVGQSGSLSSTKNIAYGIDSNIAWPVAHRYNVTVGVRYLARSATIQGSNGAQTDRWDTTLGEVSGHLGLGYLW